MCKSRVIFCWLFIVANINTVQGFSQTKRNDYCACKEGGMIPSSADVHPDSLYTTYSENETGLVITIFNTTKDTVNIFNSYLRPSLLSSKYLHRINSKRRIYKISFLPLVPYLFTKYSDVITGESITGSHQIVYDFFKLPPGTSQEITLLYQDLFRNKNSSKNVSKDYDVKSLHKYSKGLPQDFCTAHKLKGKYSLQFEFAVYKSVSILCEQSAYYLREQEFDKQSKDFRVLTSPVELNNLHYPLVNK